MTDKQVELLIQNDNTIYVPLIQDQIVWETQRKGSPGKLTFSIVSDNSSSQMKLNIQEGNQVILKYGGESVFSGFLFTKSRSGGNVIHCVAYDQTRYLKNQYYYEYENKKASELLLMIANDFNLVTGEIEDTSISLSRREEKKTLFDIILNALDETLHLNGKLFILYDDFGKLCLRSAENWKIDYVICDQTAENLSYESSIDQETYNQIKLYSFADKKSERKTVQIVDDTSIKQWGILQLCQEIKDDDPGEEMAKGYLQQYNKKSRSLSISGAWGDIRARAGSSVMVNLKLGDIDANTYLMIESAKHIFSDSEYRMNLSLRGDVFV